MPFDGASLSQVKRDLIAAKELLLTYGWRPECGYYRTKGPHCIMTAVTVASGQRWYEAASKIEKVLKVHRGFGAIPAFNDAQTSIEPVLALLDEAIANA